MSKLSPESNSGANKALWGGRFQASADALAVQFNASVQFDKQLYREDIQGSRAHAQVLQKAGIINPDELKQIDSALGQIEREIAAGEFNWQIAHEDVHGNIEARLTELLGDLGKKLHTGRSRNDQVATDTRLYLRARIDTICQSLQQLQMAILTQAERHIDDIMPGYTHLQHAQPISCAHHLLAWWQMLQRDKSRLQDCRARLNECPLGAAALAGSGYTLDRQLSAQLLDFAQPMANSLDAVSARDYLLEFCAAGAILMAHLSRISEELILWSSNHFEFVELADAFCTGSSIMPQKKNPDIPELVRGKSGRVAGHFTALMMMLKATPLAYNKDFQEDKEALFDCVNTLSSCLSIFTELIASMELKPANMLQAANKGHLAATDLADYLVRKGVAFRDAHGISGRIVALAISSKCNIDQLELAQLQALDQRIDADIYPCLQLSAVVNARQVLGGTAFAQVRAQLELAREQMP